MEYRHHHYYYFFLLSASWLLMGAACTKENLKVESIRQTSSEDGAQDGGDSSLQDCEEGKEQSQDCRVVAGKVVTSSLGTHLSADASSPNILIPKGYYDGSKQLVINDPSLLASNIKSGVSLFGVSGSAVGPYPACVENDGTLNSNQCSTSLNRYVYSSVFGGRGNVCSQGANSGECWTNSSNSYVTGTVGASVSLSTGVLANIPTGYYTGGETCSVGDSNFAAENIAAGSTVLGVTGTYTGLLSQMARDRGETQKKVEEEGNGGAYAANASYGRAVPDVALDDDGNIGGNVTHVDRATWGASTCGATGSLNSRISNCSVAFGVNATWDGAAKGNSGQGVWRLVTRTGSVTSGKGREVWRDERTGLLWSSVVSTGLNWCKASGANSVAGNPGTSSDSSGICDSIYQNSSNPVISACFEDNGTNFTSTDTGIDSAGKAGLDLSSTPKVAWRLPTMNDFKQADLNGLRFVVPDLSSGGVWSSTITSSSRSYAYFFGESFATFTNTPRSNAKSVRCVGHVIPGSD